MRSEAQIRKENEINRNVTVMKKFGSISIGEYLDQYIHTSWNFLINGTGRNRERVLYHRMKQLYSDKEIFDRPIIMLASKDSPVLDDFERDIKEKRIHYVRPFVKVSQENPYYNPFLEMEIASIEEVVEATAKFYPTLDISQWNKTVFQAVCEILDKYGYVCSLENLHKIFSQEKSKIEMMFRADGRVTSSQSANNEGFIGIAPALGQLFQNFRMISDGKDRFSMIQEVKRRKKESMRMPFFAFVLPDGCRRDFMEYLAVEMKEISKYCKPILVIDSVELCQSVKEKGTHFYDYVSAAKDIAITLSGEACSSLIPNENEQLKKFVESKGFRMCFTQGSAATEDLTKIEVGTYIHTEINHTEGKTRGTFHFISHDKNVGHNENKVYDRLRISGDDVRKMKENEAYFTYREKVMLVKNLIFE